MNYNIKNELNLFNRIIQRAEKGTASCLEVCCVFEYFKDKPNIWEEIVIKLLDNIPCHALRKFIKNYMDSLIESRDYLNLIFNEGVVNIILRISNGGVKRGC